MWCGCHGFPASLCAQRAVREAAPKLRCAPAAHRPSRQLRRPSLAPRSQWHLPWDLHARSVSDVRPALRAPTASSCGSAGPSRLRSLNKARRRKTGGSGYRQGAGRQPFPSGFRGELDERHAMVQSLSPDGTHRHAAQRARLTGSSRRSWLLFQEVEYVTRHAGIIGLFPTLFEPFLPVLRPGASVIVDEIRIAFGELNRPSVDVLYVRQALDEGKSSIGIASDGAAKEAVAHAHGLNE